ncbi:MAG: AarF/ABC1/UbiB kinase family protein, partial [Akkermansiaceae bacterium]|nr:AarF/ABC1/UbiB kinase family protein [Akkermansiaceae bacterium]
MTRWWNYVRFFRALLDPRKDVCPAQIEGLGLLAVKIAQMYAVRADLIGFQKSRQLRGFFEDARPVPPGEIEGRFLKAAPASLLSALRSWDRTPAAAASIGQVHRGTLRDGTEVAIKIVKADAREEFQSQVRSLRRFLRIVIAFYPKLGRLADPLGVLASVERSTLRELDLRSEVEGLDVLRRLRDEGAEQLPHLSQLEFPKVYREFSGPDLLVSEWRSEPSLNDLIARRDFSYEQVLALFRIHGYFLFVRGTFHGDLHPGNVLYQDGRFVFLDNANVESAPPELTRGILGMLSALGDDDITTAAECIASTSTKPLPQTSRDRLL